MNKQTILTIILFFVCTAFQSYAEDSCRTQVKAMEQYKDLNNKKEWIIRTNYFRIPDKWSVHGTFDYLALPVKSFPDGENSTLEIQVKGKAGNKVILKTDFEVFEQVYKSKGEKISRIIRKNRNHNDGVIFLLKNKNSKTTCQFYLPFQKNEG